MSRLLVLALALAGCTAEPPPAACDHVDANDPGGTLGDLARARGLHAGAFLFGSDGAPPDYFPALHEFDLLTLPIFFRLVEPQRDAFDFSLPDAVIADAPPGTTFYVPGFSNDNLPDWLVNGNFTGAERELIMTTFIRNVMNHIADKAPARVIAWEIVFEPMSWDNAYGFWNRIGLDKGRDIYEYMRVAYRTARETLPEAKLYTDEFWIEGGGERTDKLFDRVKSLRDEGVPIDGVGFEGHFMLGGSDIFHDVPSRDVLVANLDRFGALGVETMYTSVDVSIRDADVSPATLSQQADAYRRLVDACTCAASCAAFSTWGIGDPDSWIPQQYMGWGRPLMFDAHYARKPAYDAVRAGFLSAH